MYIIAVCDLELVRKWENDKRFTAQLVYDHYWQWKESMHVVYLSQVSLDTNAQNRKNKTGIMPVHLASVCAQE